MADVRSKALSYYRDGKVHLLHARTRPDERIPCEVVAVVVGFTGVRRVELVDGRWTCSCQAVVSDGTTCAHVAAVQQCTDPEHSAAAKPAKTERTQAA